LLFDSLIKTLTKLCYAILKMPSRPTDVVKSHTKESETNAGNAKGLTGSGKKMGSVKGRLTEFLSKKETSAKTPSRVPPSQSPDVSQSSSGKPPTVPPKDEHFLRQAHPRQSKVGSLQRYTTTDCRLGSSLLGALIRPVVSTAQLEIPPIPEVSTRPNSYASSNGSRESGESIVVLLDTSQSS